MKRQLSAVDQFHHALDIAFTQQMQQEELDELRNVANRVLQCAQQLENDLHKSDRRWLRAHLLLEEVGECIKDMALGNEVGAFDGLIDLLYVLLGTALTFQWPLEAGFDEVHRSNMTKRKQATDALADRVREKGTDYKPPQLEPLLAGQRCRPPMIIDANAITMDQRDKIYKVLRGEL